jgi:TolB-like protein
MTQTRDLVPETGGDVNPERVHRELARIMTSPAFSRAERPARFLAFLVEHALRGERGKLNEYVLASEVFHRRPDFDPASDPIVRVEAGRLRRRLQDYYAGEGQDSPLRIELPARRYVPVFREMSGGSELQDRKTPIPVSGNWKPAAAVALSVAVITLLATPLILHGGKMRAAGANCQVRSAAQAGGAAVKSIALTRFDDLSPNRDHRYFCDGLSDELADAISRVSGVEVRMVPKSVGLQPLDAAVVVTGAIRVSGNQIEIEVAALDGRTRGSIWSRTYFRRPADAIAIHDEIARNIADAILARQQGVPLRAVMRNRQWE